MAKTGKESVLVKVAEEQRGEISALISKMKKAGLEGGTDLGFGRVKGVIAPEKREALKAIPGVEDVRPELTFREM